MAKPQRAFALVAALLLLASSVAFSGLVVWQMANNDDKKVETTDDIPADIRAQLEAQQNQQQGDKTMLQGTKLASFTPVSQVSELQIIDLQPGTGEAVPEGATITAHYTGALAADGTIFQSSKDTGQPIAFSLDGVIQGWTKGVPGMKVGGIRRLIIPAAMAYGSNPPSGSGIPADAPLVFDIELVKLGQ